MVALYLLVFIFCLKSESVMDPLPNIFWPVYKNVEKQLNDLAFSIHIDDKQLCVYSSKITDLILRCAIEIETLSKELYKANGGTKTGYIKYDDDAIKYLKNLWVLDKKIVIISSVNCFQTNRYLSPFVKNEKRTGTEKMTYGWNNSYQNLKHDRSNAMEFGNLSYLFQIMAALYLLNIYFKNQNYELGDDMLGTSFPENQGSSIFSIEVARVLSFNKNGRIKENNFDECTYYFNHTEDTLEQHKEALEGFEKSKMQLFMKHPKLIEFITSGKAQNYSGENMLLDALGSGEYSAVQKQAIQNYTFPNISGKYVATLNKNNL